MLLGFECWELVFSDSGLYGFWGLVSFAEVLWLVLTLLFVLGYWFVWVVCCVVGFWCLGLVACICSLEFGFVDLLGLCLFGGLSCGCCGLMLVSFG